jgi:hypothetical protein
MKFLVILVFAQNGTLYTARTLIYKKMNDFIIIEVNKSDNVKRVYVVQAFALL